MSRRRGRPRKKSELDKLKEKLASNKIADKKAATRKVISLNLCV
jgi:hypothetical protein